MKATILTTAALLIAGTLTAQSFQNTLGLFAKKSIPYESPTEFHSDQYLEDGEATTIPFKVLSNAQFEQISGIEECDCSAYAVDYLELKGGKKGLIVYQVNAVEVMPFEELSYNLYVVDGTGMPIDYVMLSMDFFTSDIMGDVSISEQKKSTINYGEYEDMKERLFIEMTYETSEIAQADFGQIRTVISMSYMEILPSGMMTDVTVYLEE